MWRSALPSLLLFFVFRPAGHLCLWKLGMSVQCELSHHSLCLALRVFIVGTDSANREPTALI